MRQGRRRAPRWWRWFRAKFCGYFWLPCPECGEPFSGHEVQCYGLRCEVGILEVGAGPTWIPCPLCEWKRSQDTAAELEDHQQTGGTR